MEKMILKFQIVLISFLTICGTSNAQLIERQLTSSGGGQESVATSYFSYSIGEPITGTINGSLVLTQGMQQGYKVLSSTINNSIETIRLYPNPTSDYFSLSGVDDHNIKSVSIRDIYGRLVMGDVLILNGMYDISKLTSGYYFIECNMQNSVVQTGALIKM